jgi:hypothetical protein
VFTGIETDAQRRDQIAIDASTLTHWDTNNNGIWDKDERTAYQAAVQALAKQWSRQGAKKRWFLLHEDTVIGPIRVSDLDSRQKTPTQLICLDGKSGWVAIRHVLNSVEA